MLHNASSTMIRRGRPLAFEGQEARELIFLHSGSARAMRKSFAHKEILTGLLRGPVWIGAAEALAGVPLGERIVTLETCRTSIVSAAIFRDQCARDPELARSVHAELAAVAAATSDLALEATIAKLEPRIASLLADYAIAGGALPDARGFELPYFLSQERLAFELAVSRRATGIAVRNLRAEGLIEVHADRYLIPDVALLRSRSSGRRSIVRSGDVLTFAREPEKAANGH